MTFTLLAIIALSQADVDVPSTVDPLSRLLPALGQRAGMKLFAGESVKDDVVGIASPKRPIKELMDGIAEAVNGTWEERKEGWVLLRTKTQVAQDAATDAAFRATWIMRALDNIDLRTPFDEPSAKALAAYRTQFKTGISFGRGELSQLSTMNARSPVGRFSRRFVEAIGVDRVAELADGNRKVLSTNPNKSQLPLKAEIIGDALQKFRLEQNIYASAIADPVDSRTAGRMSFYSGFDFVKPIPETWNRILVAVDSNDPFRITVTVNFVDSSGNYLASAPCTFLRTDLSRSAPPAPAQQIIEFSTQTSEVLAALRKPTRLSESQRKLFVNPVENEPLAFVHTDGLAKLSEVRKKPVFVLFDDRQNSPYAVSNPYRLGQYLTSLNMWSTVTEDPKRILVQPSEPASAALHRINRAVIRDFVADINRQGVITLENYVNLSRANNGLFDFSVQSFLVLPLPPKFSGQPELHLLRLIALASPPERQRLLAGGDLRFGDMNPAQRAWATRVLYNVERFYPSVTAVNGVIPTVRPVDREITEVCPNGLPDDVTFSVQYAGGDALRFKHGGETHEETVDGTVAYVYGREPTGPKEFQVGTIRRLSLRLQVNPMIYQWGGVTESRIDDSVPWKPYSELPSEIRTKLDELIRKRREQYNLPPDLPFRSAH